VLFQGGMAKAIKVGKHQLDGKMCGERASTESKKQQHLVTGGVREKIKSHVWRRAKHQKRYDRTKVSKQGGNGSKRMVPLFVLFDDKCIKDNLWEVLKEQRDIAGHSQWCATNEKSGDGAILLGGDWSSHTNSNGPKLVWAKRKIQTKL